MTPGALDPEIGGLIPSVFRRRFIRGSRSPSRREGLSPGGGLEPDALWRFLPPLRETALEPPAHVVGELLVGMRCEPVEPQRLLGLLGGITKHRDLGAGLGEPRVEAGIGRV